MAITIAEVTFGPVTSSLIVDIDQGYMSSLALQILSPTVTSAPSSLTVSVADAMGGGVVVFQIDGIEVFRVQPDPEGGIYIASIPVPDLRDGAGNVLMGPGAHTLTAIQGQAIGSGNFWISNPPETLGENIAADALPTMVPGSVQPDGTRRWVFQDLAPGGLGSWVLPMNPEDMGSPPFARELNSRSSTNGDTFHITENAWEPVGWEFSGYCPTKEMREKFEAFHALNRRWYLHDHRGRAWKVTFQDLEMTPRLTQYWNGVMNHEGHDYEATVLVMDRDWTQVQP